MFRHWCKKNKNCFKVCSLCNGSGNIVQLRQMGPMTTQSISTCYQCKGEGKTIDFKDFCPDCKGKKFETKISKIDYYIRPGMHNGDKIILRGQGNWEEGCQENGDLYIIINELKSKKVFIREGENLLYTKKIDLVDALCGNVFIIKHLDNRHLKIDTKNMIIQNNQHMKIKNEGMKKSSEGLEYGDLIIKFVVKFPEKLSNERKKYLKKILPLTQKQIWDIDPDEISNYETVKLEYLDNDDIKTNTNTNPNTHSQSSNNYNRFKENINNEFENEYNNTDNNPIDCQTQ